VTVRSTAGPLGEAIAARLQSWAGEGIVGRIWAQDPTVWAETDLPELSDRLGWLTLPEEVAGRIEDLTAFGAEIMADGFEHVVLCGMGGSSLAPEMYARTFGSRPGHPELIVLDSTHPGAVAAVRSRIDPATTLFLVSSKSGGTIETLSFMRYFWHEVVVGGLPPGERFVAITDPGSGLADLAAERGFRRTFHTPPEVGGRYSALTDFGLVPAALIGVDLGALSTAARTAAESAGATVMPEDNPAAHIGAFWAEAALAGRDKLTISTSPSLAAFPDWLEQLIAESTGKDGTGIVPVVGEQPGALERYGNDRAFLHYQLASDGEPPQELVAPADAGHPTYVLLLAEKYDLASEIFYAELATAAAGSALGIHPFNQPNVQLAKAHAQAVMEGEGGAGAVIAEWGGGETAEIASFLTDLEAGAYLGIHAYLAPTRELDLALGALRTAVSNRAVVATTAGYGPRFLHSTGQLHKGGPRTGVFLQIVDDPGDDLPIPDSNLSFGRLITAQADGDYQALVETRHSVARVRLTADPAGQIMALAAAIADG
jgi:transaldolase/glucose-6-phosphate isomerase